MDKRIILLFKSAEYCYVSPTSHQTSDTSPLKQIVKRDQMSRPAKKAPEGLHKEDIKAAVWKAGSNLRQLSLDNGLAPATCRNALHKPIPKADKAIANFLGKTLHEVWPNRYDKDGNRIKKSDSNLKEKSPLSHRQKNLVNFTERGAE